MAETLGLTLDPWQRNALATATRNLLLLASRQAGKSTVSAILALNTALTVPQSLSLLISPSERQSKRLLKVVRGMSRDVREPIPPLRDGTLSLELRNGSEIHALPGNEGTIRGFAAVDLLIIDEASRVADDLYTAVRPMLAVSGGRLVAISTPFGKRGWFWDAWTTGEGWHREQVMAHQVPRISKEFLAEELAAMGPNLFAQEYECAFLDAVGQVFSHDLIDSLFVDVEPLFGSEEPAWSQNLIVPMGTL